MAGSSSQPPRRRSDPPHAKKPSVRQPKKERGPHFAAPLDSFPDILQQFRQEIEEYEKTEGATYFQMLRERGVPLPAPKNLDDAELARHLERLIQELAQMNVYLRSTDHLSDRELYAHLWKELLREHRPPPLGSDDVVVLDLVNGGSAADIINWLRFYADEESRAHWQASFPDEPILPREKPPYDRDRTLPKPKARPRRR